MSGTVGSAPQRPGNRYPASSCPLPANELRLAFYLHSYRLLPLISVWPIYASVFRGLDALDPRAPESWREPGERNRLLMRNATSTRHEYEGTGLMGALARHLMRTAAAEGFKMINIECLSGAVTHVWSSPPPPFKGEIVAKFSTEDYREKDEATGQEFNPFHPARQLVTRVCTTLAEA